MIYLSFVSSLTHYITTWIGKGIVSINNISSDLLSGVVKLVQGAKDTFDDLGMILNYLNKAFSLVTDCIGLLPSWLSWLAFILISVYIAFQIVGRSLG